MGSGKRVLLKRGGHRSAVTATGRELRRGWQFWRAGRGTHSSEDGNNLSGSGPGGQRQRRVDRTWALGLRQAPPSTEGCRGPGAAAGGGGTAVLSHSPTQLCGGQGAGSGGGKAQDLRQPWSPLWRWGLAGWGVRWVVSLGLAGPVTWAALGPGVLPLPPAQLAHLSDLCLGLKRPLSSTP